MIAVPAGLDKSRPPNQPGTPPPPTHPPTNPPPPPPPPRQGHLPIGVQSPARQIPPVVCSDELVPGRLPAGARVGGPPAPGAGVKPVMPKARRWRGFDEIPGTAELAAAINVSLARRAS